MELCCPNNLPGLNLSVSSCALLRPGGLDTHPVLGEAVDDDSDTG